MFQQMTNPEGQFNYYPHNVVQRANLNKSLAVPPLHNDTIISSYPYDNTERLIQRDFSNSKFQEGK